MAEATFNATAPGTGRSADAFDDEFKALTGFRPLRWQQRLFDQLVAGQIPAAIDLPTGFGKTSIIAIWLIAFAHGARLPRRLVYVVDRRAVVDQATDEAAKLRRALEGHGPHIETGPGQARQVAAELKQRLGLQGPLPISTLRGTYVDNREWLNDPAAPAIIVGTVDIVGSRLLFEGYGVSRKMRPYQAGLLGTDSLVVLDEAHLVPPFAHLLRAIEQDPQLRPHPDGDREALPKFIFLPLSATQRAPEGSGSTRGLFRLEEADWKTDPIAERRLRAKKILHLEPLAPKNPNKQLAEAAWALANRDGRFSRVVVFCDRREKKSDGGAPSAEGIEAEIRKLAESCRSADRGDDAIHEPELLVGARRVRERELVADRLRELGFIGEKKPLDKPAFLIATSAGEVGVDIDADHMVMDLVAWERMVQRLGRVNRRGEGDAEIRVFWSKPSLKDLDVPTEAERRSLTAFASKEVIERLPRAGDGFDASPGALRQLSKTALHDTTLRSRIDLAETPEPLRPALNRALVDAWSMTSLETHTGRPEVMPWLRGWLDEENAQTTMIWRTHLPVRVDDRGCPVVPGKSEIRDFFDAAPPQESEKLETETYQVVNWLRKRANALLDRKRSPAKEDNEDRRSTREESNTAERTAISRLPKLRRQDVIALILSAGGAYEGCYTLEQLAQEEKGKTDKFKEELAGKLLVVDARFGGLRKGLLNSESDDPVETADGAEAWSAEVKFRVTRLLNGNRAQADGWRFAHSFTLRRDAEGQPLERLVVEHFKDAAQREDARSISRPQELVEHQDWTRNAMVRIAETLGLSTAAANALAVAASLHDEGKKAPRWQRAFNASRDAKAYGLVGPLAKTRGPIDSAILGAYRHEFSSLPYVEASPEFRALPEEWQELVLHLVAAHHGQARPVIDTHDCEDGPPSLLEERACAVALRFARLQKRWGPWGLAWWEALLRAADQQASRANEERGDAV